MSFVEIVSGRKETPGSSSPRLNPIKIMKASSSFIFINMGPRTALKRAVQALSFLQKVRLQLRPGETQTPAVQVDKDGARRTEGVSFTTRTSIAWRHEPGLVTSLLLSSLTSTDIANSCWTSLEESTWRAMRTTRNPEDFIPERIWVVQGSFLVIQYIRVGFIKVCLLIMMMHWLKMATSSVHSRSRIY